MFLGLRMRIIEKSTTSSEEYERLVDSVEGKWDLQHVSDHAVV